MEINRIWAMADSKTFNIKPIARLLGKYVKGGVIIDPFSNGSKWGTITNDLNPEFNTDFHLDALEFLNLMETNSADVVLFDPPYSPRQVSECYKGVGLETTMESTQASFWSNCKNEIKRIIKTGGLCISFGWNSTGMGKNRCFEIIEILMVPHGGQKNDTICTVEKKFNYDMF